MKASPPINVKVEEMPQRTVRAPTNFDTKCLSCKLVVTEIENWARTSTCTLEELVQHVTDLCNDAAQYAKVHVCDAVLPRLTEFATMIIDQKPSKEVCMWLSFCH